MVGMTRAHMADPQIVNKLRSAGRTRSGRASAHRIVSIVKVHCIHNPATAADWLPQVIGRSPHAGRKAVVVGAAGWAEGRGWLAPAGPPVVSWKRGPAWRHSCWLPRPASAAT